MILGCMFGLLLLAAASGRAAEQTGQDTTGNPLEPFSRLVGGKWQLADTYQTFHWGVGRLSVRSLGFALVDGEPKLVSEGLWFWHPEMKKIKGYFTAIEMPVAFFDYSTRFEGNRMVNELRAFSTAGSVDLYVETWEFTGTDSYQWTLSQPAADSLTKIMGGTYSRK
jgi:hypothetical protein